jgi:hypothetical protein
VRYLLATIIMLLALAGCGETSDEDQVRDAARQLGEHAQAHQWGDLCAATTEPDKCREALLMLEALKVDVNDYIPSSDLVDDAKVTVDGDRATMDATAAEDAEYVRRGDRWLLVWDET